MDCNPNCEKWDGNVSCFQCKNGFFLKEQNCVELCPSDYINHKSLYCFKKPINCDYYIDESQITQFKFDYAVKCKNCQNANCIKCDILQNNCQQCKEGYNLNADYTCTCNSTICNCPTNCNLCVDGFCSQCKYLTSRNINNKIENCFDQEVKSCPINYYFMNDSCYPCYQKAIGCSECNQDLCLKCQQGYQLTSNKCKFICPNQELVEKSEQCKQCADFNCSSCSQDSYICDKCDINFKLNNGKCEYSPESICQQKLQYCEKCDAAWIVCQTCLPKYILVNSKCERNCGQGQCYEQICSQPECDQCVNNSTQICQKCKAGYPYLIDGKCYKSCPEGYYSTSDYSCKKCSLQCKTCEFGYKCSSCTSQDAKLEDNCLCQNNLFLQDTKCVTQCSDGYGVSNKLCYRLCEDGFPVFEENRNVFYCEKVKDQLSDYCVQNIENLTRQTSFKLINDSQTDKVQFIINQKYTPAICYTYELVGKNSITKNVLQNGLTATIKAEIEKKNLYDNNFVQCDDQSCSLYFKVYYFSKLQYTFRIKFNLKFDLILSNDVEFQGESKDIDAICEDSNCQIPAEKAVSSNVQVICPNSQHCSYNQISAATNTEISIIQSIEDPSFKNNIILPQSLTIFFTDQGKEQKIRIKNFYFDNSQIGVIKYTFNTINLQNGKLVVVSKVYKAVQSRRRRILASQSNTENDDKFKYSQFKINFELQKQVDLGDTVNENVNDDENTVSQKTIIIILCVLGGTIIFIVIGVIIFCVKRKHRKQKSAQQEQQINNKYLDYDEEKKCEENSDKETNVLKQQE